MATRLDVQKLRDKFEASVTGLESRKALTDSGKYSRAYIEFLENWTADHYYQTNPVKVSRIKQERIALFTGKGGRK